MTHRADAIYKKTTGQFLVGVQLLVNCAQLTCVQVYRYVNLPDSSCIVCCLRDLFFMKEKNLSFILYLFPIVSYTTGPSYSDLLPGENKTQVYKVLNMY